MNIEYKRYDFAKGTVETREREIDTERLLAGNAFYQRLKAKTPEKVTTYQRLNFGPDLP